MRKRGDRTANGLQMAPEEMLDLARKAAELLVERIHKLPGEGAWDGEFRDGLKATLMEAPPEQGRPGDEVIERADSIGLDAHKWLFQPYEAGCLLVKDADTLEKAFGVHHDVLQDTVRGANHPNFSDRGLQLSRSFRALKVWMSIQTFGLAAFRDAIAKRIRLAARAQEYVEASPMLDVVSPASLGVVCFRVNPARISMDDEGLDEINRKVLAQMFWDDPSFISSASPHGRFSLRLCIINHNTRWTDVKETLQAVERFGADAIKTADQ